MNYDRIRDAIIAFNKERDWFQFYTPKEIAVAMSVEASELLEEFLWMSSEDSVDHAKTTQNVQEEFADVFNYMVLFAEITWIDIEQAVMSKLEKNAKKYPVEKAKWVSTKYDEL